MSGIVKNITLIYCSPCCGGGGLPRCSFTLESRFAEGAGYHPSPCGYYNPEDQRYYLTRTTTREITLRPADEQPTELDCVGASWKCKLPNGTCPEVGVTIHGKISTHSSSTDYDYASESISTIPAGETECSCGIAPPPDETMATYTIDRVVSSTLYQEDCETPWAGGLCQSGLVECNYNAPAIALGPKQVIDTDESNDAYSDEWTCEIDVENLANESLEDNWEASGWSSSGATTSNASTVEGGVDGPAQLVGKILYAGISRAAIRWQVEGNSGYAHVLWDVCNEEGDVDSSGSEMVTWEPGTQYEGTLIGPTLEATFDGTNEVARYLCNVRTYCTEAAYLAGEGIEP